VDNTTGDKLGVWRDMRLADALVTVLVNAALMHVPQNGKKFL